MDRLLAGEIGSIAIIMVQKRSECSNCALLQSRSSTDRGTNFISARLGEVKVPLSAGQCRCS